MQEHKLLSLDFETYYDDEYSLKNLPIPNYIFDPRYETIMCAAKVDNGPSLIIDGPDVPAYLGQFDAAHTTTICYNALFDNSILAWRYNFIPATMIDAMGMVRALLGSKLRRFSLATVAQAMGIGAKGNTLASVKGMRREQIMDAGLWKDFGVYALQDVNLCYKIFLKLYPDMTPNEMKLMDLVLRCAVEPKFMCDTAMLTAHLQELKNQKQFLLDECGVTVEDLMSADKFKNALEAVGVEVQYKVTPSEAAKAAMAGRTAKRVPAFAKTDEFMANLALHPDPAVQALAAARLGHKSTIEETRTVKLLSIAGLPWPVGSGTLPIPLRYGGAHTQRLSGDWGMNMQNLPSSRKGGSKLRKSLLAPPGHKAVTGDLGQIEARLVAWICGAKTLLKQFADKLDPYAKLGEQIFGYPVDRKVQKVEGFIGKTGILGLGYACGATKFFNMVKVLARTMGIDLGEVWTPALADKAVGTYRRANPQIPQGWRTLDTILQTAWMGTSAPQWFGPVLIGPGKITGPGGLSLYYEAPCFDAESGDYYFYYGGAKHKIYGAKMLENIVQFLARIIVMNAALRMAARGYKFQLQAHDELVYIVPDDKVDEVKKLLHMELTRRPTWAPDLPLAADIGVGQSYGEAK